MKSFPTNQQPNDSRAENMIGLVILYCAILALAFLIWVTR